MWRGDFSSPYPDENAEAERIGLELGVDVHAGLPRQKPWWIVMVSQIPKLVLKVDHAEVQPTVFMVVDAATKLVNDAVVGLARSVRNVTGADHEVAIRAESFVDVMQFGAEHESTLLAVGAGAIGKARSYRRLAEHKPSQAEVCARGKALVPAISVESVVRRRGLGRVIQCGIEVGLDQGIGPIDIDLTSATLDRGYHLGIRRIWQHGSRHEDRQS